MEEIIKTVLDYVSTLIIERWVEIAMVFTGAVIYRWWMGYKLRDRIVALEAQQKSAPEPNLSGNDSSFPVSLKEKIETLEEKAQFPKIEELWIASPRVGRLAAKVIMKAPSFEDVEAVHAVFMSAPQRTDASWAHYAFLYRLEMEGRSNEVMTAAHDIVQQTGDDFILDYEDEEVKKLVNLYHEDDTS